MVTARDIVRGIEPKRDEVVHYTLGNLARLTIVKRVEDPVKEREFRAQEAFFDAPDFYDPEVTRTRARVNAMMMHQSYLERMADEAAENSVYADASRRMTESELPVTELARNAINEFVQEHRYDLASVGTGLKHFFARRKLKKALDQAVYMECGLRHTEEDVYNAARNLASEVFDRLVPQTTKMADAYLTSDEVGGADIEDLVDMSIKTCAMTAHKDMKESAASLQERVLQKYGEPEIGPIADLLEPEKTVEIYAAPGFWAKAASYARATAAAVAVALTFGAAVPADNTVQYENRIADDGKIMYVDAVEPMQSSYAFDAAEAPAPVETAPAPRPRPRTNRTAPADNTPTDAHTNPRAEPMPRVSSALSLDAYVPANVNGMDELARPQFRDSTTAGYFAQMQDEGNGW